MTLPETSASRVRVAVKVRGAVARQNLSRSRYRCSPQRWPACCLYAFEASESWPDTEVAFHDVEPNSRPQGIPFQRAGRGCACEALCRARISARGLPSSGGGGALSHGVT